LSDELPPDLRPVADFFGLPGAEPVAKDFAILHAIRALVALDAAPFTLAFGGGTALARAHKLVQRMSEDVDFKIVPTPAAPVSRSGLHRQRSALRDRVTAALQAAGFAFDPKEAVSSRDESSYTIYQLPYTAGGAGEGLRPTIQIELKHATLRLPRVTLPVSSFVAEALSRAPEVPAIACVSVTETAAEKLVSLTRRTAMDLAGLSRDFDPALVRHIYDLHVLRNHVDRATVIALARDIAAADAEEFRNQYPAYHTDIAGETRKALEALRTDPVHRERYDRFVAIMVYGDQVEFEEAMETVADLVGSAWSARSG
jgi:predicted nucleotidyltransferase component of viral defense system